MAETGETCGSIFLETCKRIEAAVKSRWPETLEDGQALVWARDFEPELYRRMKGFEKQLDEFWDNDVPGEVKRFCTEWGRAMLEIFKRRAAHMRQQEAV